MTLKNQLHLRRIWQKISFFTLISIIVILSVAFYIEKRNDNEVMKKEMNNKIQFLMAMSEIAVASPLWDYNLESVTAFGHSLFEDSEVAFVIIKDYKLGVVYEQVNDSFVFQDPYLTRSERPIYYEENEIGSIEIGVTSYFKEAQINNRFKNRAYVIVLSMLALTIIIIYISATITKPLKKLGEGAAQIGAGNYETQIEVFSNDEVGELTTEFNEMAKSIYKSKEELKILNEKLEQRVKERTVELTDKNEVLNETLQSLNETRDELIRTAKMTLTSQLVAGVAHEINTPLGVALTSSTFLNGVIQEFIDSYTDGKITRKEFEETIEMMKESNLSVQRNLLRSVDLVNSFKQLATDQYSQQMRQFNLKEYFNDLFISYKNEFKLKKHEIKIRCPDDLIIKSNPSAYLQVFTNLMSNSLIHGFEDKSEGHILIEVKREADALSIIYEDDGKGIPRDSIEHIFDPFFSSKRNMNRSGLGLSIVRNAITNTLGGSIECNSVEGEGVIFTMDIPFESQSEDEMNT